jgi:hypothetical protein
MPHESLFRRDAETSTRNACATRSSVSTREGKRAFVRDHTTNTGKFGYL